METLSKRQNDILEATIDVIGENGVQGLTIKLLAERVGVSEPALHRHFQSKQDILLSVLKRFEENMVRIFDLAEKSGKKGLDQIEEVYMYHFTTFAQRPSVAAIIFAADYFRDDRQLARKVLEIMKIAEESIIAIINSSEKKEYRTDIPPKEIALILMGSFRLLVTQWRLSEYGFNLVVEGRKLCDSLRKLIVGT